MTIKKSLKEYQITTAGKIKGINIPTGHRLVVTKATIRGNETDDGYELWIEICTYEDSNHSILLINDLFPANNLTFDLGATLPTKSLQSVVKIQLETWMITNIGDTKWTEIK